MTRSVCGLERFPTFDQIPKSDIVPTKIRILKQHGVDAEGECKWFGVQALLLRSFLSIIEAIADLSETTLHDVSMEVSYWDSWRLKLWTLRLRFDGDPQKEARGF